MAYFLNTNIDENNKLILNLSKIYGIGKVLSKKICNQLNLNENIKFNQLIR